jgi:hypothetical protein
MKMSPSPAIFCVTLLLTAAALAREPANLDEAKKCVFFVQTFGADNKPRKHGTAFVMETEGIQWVYTNAHVIEGAKRIEFTDSEGKIVTGMGRFACFASGVGAVELTQGKEKKEVRFGEDGVRIELTSKREFAFAPGLDPKFLAVGASVTTLGDNEGDKALNVLEGRVVASNGKVVISTCNSREGSSGGPLISGPHFKVIGLNTWGTPAGDPAEALWRDKSSGVGGASILAEAKWLQMKAGDFLKSSTEAMKFRDTVRAMFLVYLLIPQEDGFKIDPRTKVYATNLTFEEAFKRFDEDGALRPVIRLNRQLEGRGQGIGVNNMELVKIYSRALAEIRRSYLAQRKAVDGKVAPYFLADFKNSGFFEAGDWLEQELAKPQTWFGEKAKLGGSMPVGRWFNLRPLSDLGN